MDFSSYVSDVLSALSAAVVIAAVAWCYSWSRNLKLERALKGAISPNGVGTSYSLAPLSAEFSLQIHNYTSAYIRVWSVVLIAEKWHIELSPSTKHGLFQTPLSNEVTRPKFQRTFVAKGPLEEDSNPHSRVLPPKTMAIWEVWPGTIGQHDWKLVRGLVVFEYPTLFGNTALIRMEIPESSFKLIRETFEELNTCYRERRPLPHPSDRARA
ncbi:hypothetical protein FHR55_001363 [Xanthomonas arboricola]